MGQMNSRPAPTPLLTILMVTFRFFFAGFDWPTDSSFILPRREYSTHSRQVTAGEVGQEVV
jgi:hypothetical protein